MIAVRRSILALAVAALVAVMAGCAEETRVPAFGRDIDELLRQGAPTPARSPRSRPRSSKRRR
jgi:hypothetical protein